MVESEKARWARFGSGVGITVFMVGLATAAPTWLASEAPKWTALGLPAWSPWVACPLIVGAICWNVWRPFLAMWKAWGQGLLASSLAFGLVLGLILERSHEMAFVYALAGGIAAAGLFGLVVGTIWERRAFGDQS